MKNALLKEAYDLYRIRDVEGFTKFFDEKNEEISRQKVTVVRQILRLRDGVQNPLPEVKVEREPLPEAAKKFGNRSLRRRLFSKRKVPNGAYLRDERKFVDIPSNGNRLEVQASLHATKGYRLKTRTLSPKDITSRDSGYSALILPLHDAEEIAKLNAQYRSTRLAIRNFDNYLKKATVPGGIRRQHDRDTGVSG